MAAGSSPFDTLTGGGASASAVKLKLPLKPFHSLNPVFYRRSVFFFFSASPVTLFCTTQVQVNIILCICYFKSVRSVTGNSDFRERKRVNHRKCQSDQWHCQRYFAHDFSSGLHQTGEPGHNVSKTITSPLNSLEWSALKRQTQGLYLSGLSARRNPGCTRIPAKLHGLLVEEEGGEQTTTPLSSSPLATSVFIGSRLNSCPSALW